MKSLGQSILFTSGDMFLIRSRELPKLYSNIATKDRRIVGKATDIIGPVMNPHIVVKPTNEVKKNHGLVEGKELFELPRQKKVSRDKRWKKRN